MHRQRAQVVLPPQRGETGDAVGGGGRAAPHARTAGEHLHGVAADRDSLFGSSMNAAGSRGMCSDAVTTLHSACDPAEGMGIVR